MIVEGGALSPLRTDVSRSVTVLTPLGRDATVLAELLGRAGISAEGVSNLSELVTRVRAGVAVVLLSEESLTYPEVLELERALQEQPPWSEIPVVLLLAAQRGIYVQALTHVAKLAARRGVLVLQRPVPAVTLETTLKAAMQAREQQYTVRDLLVRERIAREQAEAAARAKDDFLAMVSHELRTPLSAILLWARMLLDRGAGTDMFVRGLQGILRSAQVQSQLIEDLLDVARMLTGKLRIEPEPRPLLPILEAALEVVRPSAEAKGVRLECSFDPTPALVHIDAARGQQVFWNLLSNAVKFTPEGGTVWVRLVADGEALSLSVRDSGKGIEPALLPHVFERFCQGDTSKGRRHGGLGLGLTIVHQLVELHGGEIEAESAGLGKGACFTVRFPVVRAPRAHETTRSHPKSRLSSESEFADLNVMLVEDDPELRLAIAWFIESVGARVTTFDSAPAALEFWSSTHAAERPHVVISDLGLPGQDGLSFIRSVRESEERYSEPLVPAIALTAYVREEDRRAALQAGFQCHLAKPVTPAALHDALRTVLRGSGRSAIARA